MGRGNLSYLLIWSESGGFLELAFSSPFGHPMWIPPTHIYRGHSVVMSLGFTLKAMSGAPFMIRNV